MTGHGAEIQVVEEAGTFGAMKMFKIKVKPNARVHDFEELSDGTWLACVKAPLVDSKANEELVVLTAKHFGLSKAQVSIKRGTSGHMKVVQLEN